MFKCTKNRSKIAKLLKELRWVRYRIISYARLAKVNADRGDNEGAMYCDSEYDNYKALYECILKDIKNLRRQK